jgi:hypothetical protein
VIGNRTGVNSFDPLVGMVRKGSIVGYDADSNTLQVELTESSAIRGRPFAIPVPHSFTLLQSDGTFIGALPPKNTTITVAPSMGGEYHLVGFEPDQTHLHLIPNNLTLGELLFHTTDTAEIRLDTDSNVFIGSKTSNIHVFAGSQRYPETNLITLNFQNENHFNLAYREVGGVVKRDLNPNPAASSYNGDTKLLDDLYDSILFHVGLDPTSTANNSTIGPTKNPAFVEHREIVYEFQPDSNIEEDYIESSKYGKSPPKSIIYTKPNRRASRSDTMSLSLVAPNFLLEKVQGTVVDIFGNILDLNRLPLSVGASATNTLRSSGTTANTDATAAFTNIKALERKSIAYHFEVNARKDPTLGSVKSNINNTDYNSKLLRSRFFFDIDKEGQFKLNVPASSETGNIPLLLRPENYSTFTTTDNGNPNQLAPVPGGLPVGQDIFVDSFASPQTSPSSAEAGFDIQFQRGSVSLVDGDTKADVGPPDRISQYVDNSPFNIRHGTAFHDILATCSMHQNTDQFINSPGYQLKTMEQPIDTSYIKNLTDLISTTIKVSGAGANAGGRSGSINFDGSIDMNIGANTIDKQSLWLDTAGGLVANIGRDRNARSAIVNFDGDVYIQIGGFGVAVKDTRFTGANGANIVDAETNHIGTLDIRVMAGGYAHMFRVDPQGITVMTPQTLNLYAATGMNIKCDGPLMIDSDNLHLNQRLVLVPPPATSI